MAEEEGGGEITDKQWETARETFNEKLGENEGGDVETYEKILGLMKNWESYTPAERREKSGGNHIFWHSKYSASEFDGKWELLKLTPIGDTADGQQQLAYRRCSNVKRMFDDIKEVHIESV